MSMRWTQLACSTGAVYVDLTTVDAMGPRIVEQISGRDIAMRALYLRGGQLVEILDTPENMQLLFETPKGLPS